MQVAELQDLLIGKDTLGDQRLFHLHDLAVGYFLHEADQLVPYRVRSLPLVQLKDHVLQQLFSFF